MHEFLDIPGNVLAMKFTGTVTGDDVDAAVAAANSKLAQFEAIGVLADLQDMEGMTPEAVIKDIVSQFKLLGEWQRFPKMALVADNKALEAAAKAAGAILSQIEVRTFTRQTADEALDFASSVPEEKIHA